MPSSIFFLMTFPDLCADDEEFDKLLEGGDFKKAIDFFAIHSNSITMSKDRFTNIFDAIEERTKHAEENDINKRLADESMINLGAMEYPPISPARSEMTEMYALLKKNGSLTAFGAASNNNYPAQGSKTVTPILLEQITNLSMTSLTPKPTNTLLVAGVVLSVLEGILSFATGIDLNFLFFLTLFLLFFDKLTVNGAVFETANRIIMPDFNNKVLRHEAGHFLCAYLLGCPVEGFVLSTWAALNDPRFGGKRTTVNAGTSFFDPNLSDEINGRKPLTRSSVDRYTIIVMGGIAAESLNFGGADGGAGDEMALVSFLTNLNPKSGGAMSWNIDSIKNQARWGALQAVLLLREYSDCYDALVDALERGGDLGDCVYAIENAAKEKGLPTIAEKPLGYIVDQGAFGEFVTTAPENTKPTPTATSTTEKETKLDSSLEDEVVSLEELKRQMQKKLEDIDSKLDQLDR